jgi:signal transduction histidine kinase
MLNMTIEQMSNGGEQRVQSLEDLLWTLSHDLRSPLAAVHLNIETALRRIPPGPIAAELAPPLERANEIVKQTVLLMEELLAQARDRNTLRATSSDADGFFDLRDIVHDCVSLHSAALHAARCSVTIHCEGDLVGSWQRGALFQILSNLILNATKYAPGQPIQVHATRVEKTVVLGVSDCGPGFSVHEQARAFERFHREPRDGDQKGFGLGLWIVHRAVKRLGGTLRLITAPGEGALFLMELPWAP